MIIFCVVLMLRRVLATPFFFFNDTATTEIYTLSLHDALPIYGLQLSSFLHKVSFGDLLPVTGPAVFDTYNSGRSEEHTSELQSRSDLVCRLLLEKKKRKFLPPRSVRDQDY